MTNEQKFDSAEKRRVAYQNYCEECGKRHYAITDEFGWLELEYKEDLKPCPFCGGENIGVYKSSVADVWYATCNGCGCKIDSYTDRDLAINNWNNRARK